MKTIEEINRAIHDGQTPPIVCIDDFLEHVTRETFDALYAQLDPKLQRYVTEHGKQCMPEFDAIVDEMVSRGDPRALEAWLAFREWCDRQPWADEARKQPKMEPWTEEQTAAFQAVGFVEAELRVSRFFLEKLRGTPEEARAAAAVAEMERAAARIAARAEAILPKKK